MIFSSGNQHDRENALLWVMITQNETSPLVEKTAAKALISFVIATFHPAEPRRYCHISTSAIMPPGALTARLSSFLRNRLDKSPHMKPGRSRTQRAVLKPRSTAPSSVHFTPDGLRSASISETPTQCERHPRKMMLDQPPQPE